MSIVTLVSGGLDSTLMSYLVHEQGTDQMPLFINYNQLNFENEYNACMANLKKFGVPPPQVIDISSYGKIIPSGLTSKDMNISEEAFLPGRNLMFLLLAAAYAVKNNIDTISIGLLDETLSLFPDQTKEFLAKSENLLSFSLNSTITILAPFIDFSKADVVALAKSKGIENTYSCHAGTIPPCGVCIACKEYSGIKGV